MPEKMDACEQNKPSKEALRLAYEYIAAHILPRMIQAEREHGAETAQEEEPATAAPEEDTAPDL